MIARAAGVLAVAIAFTSLLGAASPPVSSASVFSDPIPIAETTVAAPPAAVALDGLIHLFWLHRPSGSPAATGELWHAAVGEDGRVTIPPRRLHAGADTRFAWPVAVRSGDGLYVAWMARRGDRVGIRLTVLAAAGEIQRVLSPASDDAEEGGRIALLAAGEPERIHLAWSQFDRGERRVWYARLTSEGGIEAAARPLVPGEAAALAGGPPLRLLWWKPAGAGTFTLNAGELDEGVSGVVELTGSILLVNPLPPIPLPAPNGLDVLVPTTERAFRTSGQLYLIRIRGADVTARLPLSRGRPLSDVAAPSGEGRSLVVWSEGAGRRQNNEIFSARFDGPTGQLLDVVRVSYTVPGSIRPTMVDGRVVMWLETRDISLFQVVTAQATGGRRRPFLLGVPELDPGRPLQALLFAATAAVSVLPFAALFAAVFGVAALALGALARMVLGEFAWWEELRSRPALRLGGFLAAVLALEIVGRGMIPGEPGIALLAGALAVPATPAIRLLSRGGRGSGIAALAGVSVVLLVQMVTALFPWAAGQLSQL